LGPKRSPEGKSNIPNRKRRGGAVFLFFLRRLLLFFPVDAGLRLFFSSSFSSCSTISLRFHSNRGDGSFDLVKGKDQGGVMDWDFRKEGGEWRVVGKSEKGRDVERSRKQER
jgi:hypothetical protein